jgi:hypothetical protein
MGQIDYRCYKIAHNIICDLFIPNFKQYISDNDLDYNIDILKIYVEYKHSQLNNNTSDPDDNISNLFTSEERNMILDDAYDIIFMELEVYDIEVEVEPTPEFDKKIYDIINHYIHEYTTKTE